MRYGHRCSYALMLAIAFATCEGIATAQQTESNQVPSVLLRFSDSKQEKPGIVGDLTEANLRADQVWIDEQIQQAQLQLPLLPSPQIQPSNPITAAAPSPGVTPQNQSPGPTGPTSGISLASALTRPGFGQFRLPPALSTRRGSESQKNSTSVVQGGESKARLSKDAGNLLRLSPTAVGVSTPRRNPVTTDTRVRGQRMGQLVASGSYWVPARADLDTMLNKIDSRIVEDVLVIKGPYSSRFGPGANFVDVELLHAPRSSSGRDSGGSTVADYRLNGEQFYGRQTLWAADEDWGLHVSYGHGTGNDYMSGAPDVQIPASYNSRELYLVAGRDLGDGSTLEFNYLRLDQTGVEFPGQAFDIDYLVTNAYEVMYRSDATGMADRLEFETWYNETRFAGSASRKVDQFSVPA